MLALSFGLTLELKLILIETKEKHPCNGEARDLMAGFANKVNLGLKH